MPRLLFEKTGNAVWISHLDLMRLFQRSFKRAGLALTHSKGFNPRPSVSIALPLSVGIESHCELLDFELDGMTLPTDQIQSRLNDVLVPGVHVLQVYEDTNKIKNLALLKCAVTLEYDQGIPESAIEAITELFSRDDVTVEKRSKNGNVDQNIIPMIKRIQVDSVDENTLEITALVCCQNPTLNPAALSAAIERYLPEYKADFVKYCRLEIYDVNERIFR